MIEQQLINKIEEVIAQQVRPALHSHNGDIQLAEVTEDGFVKVVLTGACSSCPGAQQTLTEVVETALRAVYPEMKAVVTVFEASEELINAALKILRKK